MKNTSATCLVIVAISMFLASAAGGVSAQDRPAATKAVLTSGENAMKRVLDGMKDRLASISVRTSKAFASVVEAIKVESDGKETPLGRVADVRTPNAKTIELRPRNASMLPAIERAILKSNLGLTPSNDGDLIRLEVPSLGEERRRQILETISKLTEEFKVSVRNQRLRMREELRQAEESQKITEEERSKAEADLERITDAYLKKIEEMSAAKEKEIMEV